MDTANLEDAAHRYREAETALDRARTALQTEAVTFLQHHATERGAQAEAVRITGWSREHLRGLRKKADDEAERARREKEVETLRRKVEELSATGEPQPAAVAPRVQVSAVVPSEPLPEMSAREFRKVLTRAMSRAKPDQRERLNLTAKTAEQLGRDKNDEVLKVAFELGLLTHDEVYGTAEPERPVSSEEPTT
jgi:FtsZ-interacting cell division protein ZipA